MDVESQVEQKFEQLNFVQRRQLINKLAVSAKLFTRDSLKAFYSDEKPHPLLVNEEGDPKRNHDIVSLMFRLADTKDHAKGMSQITGSSYQTMEEFTMMKKMLHCIERFATKGRTEGYGYFIVNLDVSKEKSKFHESAFCSSSLQVQLQCVFRLKVALVMGVPTRWSPECVLHCLVKEAMYYVCTGWVGAYGPISPRLQRVHFADSSIRKFR